MLPGKGEIEATVEGLGVDQATYLPPWSEDNSRTPRNLVGDRSAQTRCHAAAERGGGGGGGVGLPVAAVEWLSRRRTGRPPRTWNLLGARSAQTR